MTGQPTAAEVLAAHQPIAEPGYTRCTCGMVPDRWVAQHQADMLAAAGLLVTPEPVSVDDCLHERCADMAVDRFSPCRQQPEHDAQVAARALRAAARAFHCDNESLSLRDVALVNANAVHWLKARADRIDHGEAT